MFSKLRSAKLQTAALSLLALSLLLLFFRGADFGAIAENLARADLRLIALSVVLVMGTYLLRALRWQFLLRPVGRPPLRACFIATVIGFMVNFMVPPGRLGELARPYLIARREGFSASSAFGTIFLERVLDLVTVVFLVGAWLLLGPAPQGAQSSEAIYGLKVGGLTVSVGVGLGLGAMFAFVHYRQEAVRRVEAMIRWLPNRAERVAIRFVHAFGDGLGVLADRSNLARTGALSLALWLNISFAIWIGISAFGIDIPFGSTFLIVGFLTVGVAVPTPGGVGGYHVMCAAALTLLFGVDDARARAAALVNHAIAFVPVSLLGLVFFVREGVSFREVRTLERSG